MQFQHDGKRYRIAFERRNKKVPMMRSGRVKEVTSRHPYTTVYVYQLNEGEPATKAYEATVGCFTHDTYSHAEGAKQALVALSKKLRKLEGPKSFRKALWEAYVNRRELAKPVVKVSNEQKLLPAASGE